MAKPFNITDVVMQFSHEIEDDKIVFYRSEKQKARGTLLGQLEDAIQQQITEQLSEICYIIGEWYCEWKETMTDDGVPHKLGFAREDLKRRIEKIMLPCMKVKKNGDLND